MAVTSVVKVIVVIVVLLGILVDVVVTVVVVKLLWVSWLQLWSSRGRSFELVIVVVVSAVVGGGRATTVALLSLVQGAKWGLNPTCMMDMPRIYGTVCWFQNNTYCDCPPGTHCRNSDNFYLAPSGKGVGECQAGPRSRLNGGASRSKLEPAVQQGLAAAWSAMAVGGVDQDGSGKISLVEFGQAFHKASGRQMTETELDSLWAVLDKDGDGFVDDDEYAKLPNTTFAMPATTRWRSPASTRGATVSPADNATTATYGGGGDFEADPEAAENGFKTPYLVASVLGGVAVLLCAGVGLVVARDRCLSDDPLTAMGGLVVSSHYHPSSLHSSTSPPRAVRVLSVGDSAPTSPVHYVPNSAGGGDADFRRRSQGGRHTVRSAHSATNPYHVVQGFAADETVDEWGLNLGSLPGIAMQQQQHGKRAANYEASDEWFRVAARTVSAADRGYLDTAPDEGYRRIVPSNYFFPSGGSPERGDLNAGREHFAAKPTTAPGGPRASSNHFFPQAAGGGGSERGDLNAGRAYFAAEPSVGAGLSALAGEISDWQRMPDLEAGVSAVNRAAW